MDKDLKIALPPEDQYGIPGQGKTMKAQLNRVLTVDEKRKEISSA
jgi:hypothetical protein